MSTTRLEDIIHLLIIYSNVTRSTISLYVYTFIWVSPSPDLSLDTHQNSRLVHVEMTCGSYV